MMAPFFEAASAAIETAGAIETEDIEATKGLENRIELPDDSGNRVYHSELPDDSGEYRISSDSLPNTGQMQYTNKSDVSNQLQTFTSLDEMKQGFTKSYQDIKADKPPHSPDLAKWFADGGSIKIDNSGDAPAWTYIDKDNRAVTYHDGCPVFPDAAKHSTIQDIDIGQFTGDREKDKQLYLEKLEEDYGLTEIPDGYVLHHDSRNGNLQLVETDYHKTFTHTGGHSRYKETEVC